MLQAFARHPRRFVFSVVGLVLFGWPASNPPPEDSLLEAIRARDFLQVDTRNTPTTYYQGRQGPTGFEFELVRRFADQLDVSLSLDSDGNINDVLDAVRSGKADLGAAALPLDPTLPGVHFSRAIMTLQPLVVYRRGLPPIDEPGDLLGRSIGVIKGSGAGLVLRELQQASLPELGWKESADLEVADLLSLVENGELDVAVIYAHQFKLNRVFFPGIENGFLLGDPLSLAWALPADRGLGLLQRVNRFLDEMQADGTLAALDERYFGHDDYLEYVGARTFIQQANARLDIYKDEFLAAARETGFDWKLLAALGYQESHWKPQATSPTGVRGLMMLTQSTAEQVGVGNRLDPAQSISGGARYLKSVKQRLQGEIEEPDRTWMALAAYNVGLGHLYDAQKIAEMRGGDPYAWADVREALPLLQKRDWYSRVRHGYARGGEPVIYVRNIRRYYEILNYIERSQQQFFQLNQREPGEDDGSLFNVVPPVL
ncbi:membrane-bound lytic murein transglycosylase MltF [Halomonas sp. HP20-15]|uniref:membrane-bound lytic murein transglycosylase MltF n=1 Tax=Halomonas sp. HP20-15 TaxID=3085901 RepID=UPI00298267B1|nr:membrane-bound lytic murein transglycosylase MltF [Halomonas sp. HP20-15]MDW5377133.1 membrane-bound lytic murein transglycosylase MltF [Halomonas sp. HP20-15]